MRPPPLKKPRTDTHPLLPENEPYRHVDVRRKVQSANEERINELHVFFQGFPSDIGDYYPAMAEVINSFGSSTYTSFEIDKAIEILSTKKIDIKGVKHISEEINIDESVQKYGCYPLEHAKHIYQIHCETFPGDTANKRRLDSITAVLEELNNKGLCKTIAQQHEETLRQEATSSLGGKKRYAVNKQTKKRRSNKRSSTRRRRRKNIRK